MSTVSPTMQELFLADIDSILKTGTPIIRKRYSTPSRILNYTVCFPIGCLPCLVWSTTWRLLACPFQCFVNGPGFMCSNNGCTNGTDGAIGACITMIEENVKPNEVLAANNEVENEIKMNLFRVVLEKLNDPNIEAKIKYRIFDYANPVVKAHLKSLGDNSIVLTPECMRKVLIRLCYN